MRNILITGGCGFIGSNFVGFWASKYPGDNIVVLDALTYAGNKSNIQHLIEQNKINFVHGDICDLDLVNRLFSQFQIEKVVHFAAESHVDRSIAEPDAFIKTNIVGTHNLLIAAKEHWLGDNDVSEHHFHHISTDEVYGSLAPEGLPFKEINQYKPNSPYAASKASSDHLVRAYHETYGLQTTISNCSNNYGAFHFPEKLIPLTIANILNNKAIPIYGDGKQIRDWLWVEDHCRGIEQILLNGRHGEVYNIGGNNEWTNIEIVKLICTKLNSQFSSNKTLTDKYPNALNAQNNQSEQLISYVKDRLGHDRRYAIDASKIENELGFKPSISFEEGLTKTIHWYLDNPTWWQEV
jgi:dTDP-glucose 4,6-dehydratase